MTDQLIIILILTLLNASFTAITVKLFTEYVKDKLQDKRNK
jgi:hypothetical protein